MVIAEAGVNHNGSVEMARALIDAAAEAGADAVKFQTFKSEQVVSAAAPKARYQVEATGGAESQLDMVRKLELREADFRALASHAKARGIEFMSTPFDHDSLHFLAAGLDVARLKIASGEITNGPFLLAAARTGKPIVLSTGMSTMDEVGDALGVIAFGCLGAQEPPSRAAFEAARRLDEGQRILRERVVLLHCTTEYPAPFEDVNLRAMQAMREAFGLPVGYSDHTVGIGVSIAAAALGAVAVEKHFTLDRALPGPDHKASLEPSELAALVREIRGVEAALGSALKAPAPSELGNRAVARRSLVAARAIAAGEPFTAEALGALRPGTGISPMAYWSLLGTPASRDYRPGEPIEPPCGPKSLGGGP